MDLYVSLSDALMSSFAVPVPEGMRRWHQAVTCSIVNLQTGGVEARASWKQLLDLPDCEDLYQLLIVQGVTLVTLARGEYFSRVDS